MRSFTIIMVVLLFWCLPVEAAAEAKHVRVLADAHSQLMVVVDGKTLSFDDAEHHFNLYGDEWPKETILLQVLFEPDMTLESVFNSALTFRFMGFKRVQLLFRLPQTDSVYREIVMPDPELDMERAP